jgi:hypothetical protein
MLRGLVIVVIVGCLPADGFAQQNIVDRWNELDQSDVSTVHVFDDAGTVWRGDVLSLDTDGLDIMLGRMGQAKHFDVSQIVRLDKFGRDSVKDGIRKGAVTGAIVGLVITTLLSSYGRGGVDIAPFISIPTITGLYGGVGGFILDAVFRYEESVTIYEAPRAQVTRQDPSDRRGRGKSIMLNTTVSF